MNSSQLELGAAARTECDALPKREAEIVVPPKEAVGCNKRGEVLVWNLHEDGWEGRPSWEGKGDYVGRPSILGNPWVVAKHGSRERVVERYRQWLWEIVKDGLAGQFGTSPTTIAEGWAPGMLGPNGTLGREQEPGVRAAVWWALVGLWRRLQAGERLNLICYCKPALCHGDVIQSCLDYLMRVHASALPALPAAP